PKGRLNQAPFPAIRSWLEQLRRTVVMADAHLAEIQKVILPGSPLRQDIIPLILMVRDDFKKTRVNVPQLSASLRERIMPELSYLVRTYDSMGILAEYPDADIRRDMQAIRPRVQRLLKVLDHLLPTAAEPP